jgi:hypothetical protein
MMWIFKFYYGLETKWGGEAGNACVVLVENLLESVHLKDRGVESNTANLKGTGRNVELTWCNASRVTVCGSL